MKSLNPFALSLILSACSSRYAGTVPQFNEDQDANLDAVNGRIEKCLNDEIDRSSVFPSGKVVAFKYWVNRQGVPYFFERNGGDYAPETPAYQCVTSVIASKQHRPTNSEVIADLKFTFPVMDQKQHIHLNKIKRP